MTRTGGRENDPVACRWPFVSLIHLLIPWCVVHVRASAFNIFCCWLDGGSDTVDTEDGRSESLWLLDLLVER